MPLAYKVALIASVVSAAVAFTAPLAQARMGLSALKPASGNDAASSYNAEIQLIGWRTKTQTAEQIARSEARMRNTTPNKPASRTRRAKSKAQRGTSPNVRKSSAYKFQPAAPADAQNWPYSEVQIARARCTHILNSIKADVEYVAPIKKGPCGDPAPVRLRSLGSHPKVAVDPPALLNCDMVATLYDWLQKDLQPAARRLLKSPITKIETMSSYSCRNAYGRKNARLSQHGRANAMDIRGFVTAKNSRTILAAHWGPTKRSIRATQLAAQKKKQRSKSKSLASVDRVARPAVDAPAKKIARPALRRGLPAEERLAAVAGTSASTAGVLTTPMRPSVLDGMSALMARGLTNAFSGNATSGELAIAPNKLGGPAVSQLAPAAAAKGPAQADGKPNASWPVVLASTRAKIWRSKTPQARFLRHAHKTGCRRFGTVLGPEADYAHHNHFHVDLARRKMGSYCK
ncbi:MAG: extensin family protein [Filomicrobium sp.]